ncbi:hypothetical protein Q7F20_09295 [Curtobacterium sp. A7_M15]|uniref:hypothetical protein n=1 Tax=Curtobacterium sp. A7_M15 TaxID=3065241 RepID=UPI002737D099|nr:hypothetical protein [Curtobacterium sp. A7_M15]MDP4333566.1 hypothetical protein [Curtobacterium sp. A7_M15]
MSTKFTITRFLIAVAVVAALLVLITVLVPGHPKKAEPPRECPYTSGCTYVTTPR